MQVTGNIKLIEEEKTFGASGFRKRLMVLETDEQYPQLLSIDFVQDKCDLLNGYSVGQNVLIHINLRGREWINPEGEAKYFNSIVGWRIESQEGAAPAQAQSNGPVAAAPANEEDDDLPF